MNDGRFRRGMPMVGAVGATIALAAACGGSNDDSAAQQAAQQAALAPRAGRSSASTRSATRPGPTS